MAIASMTGFARDEGEISGCGWLWELKSVNSRGLETRCRLPSGFEILEPAVRQRVAARLRRGAVSVALSLSWASGRQTVRINEAVLDQIIALVPALQARLKDAAAPAIDGLLALRGVIEVDDATPTGEARAALDQALLAGLDRALDRLCAVRSEEGAHLLPALTERLDRIAALHATAAALAATQPQTILARLQQQIALLLDAAPALPADRLAQEAAVLATKADVREELDRLAAHVTAAKALLRGPDPVGRQLDFLCQELNREANTLCAKSTDVGLTACGLDLKTTIDQFREQVQNIE